MCLPNACIKIKWRKKIESINPALATPASRAAAFRRKYEILIFCRTFQNVSTQIRQIFKDFIFHISPAKRARTRGANSERDRSETTREAMKWRRG
jgi:hypothetical protein